MIKTNIKNKKILKEQFNWLYNISLYFKEHNILFSDLHSDNIMKKGKEYIEFEIIKKSR